MNSKDGILLGAAGAMMINYSITTEQNMIQFYRETYPHLHIGSSPIMPTGLETFSSSTSTATVSYNVIHLYNDLSHIKIVGTSSL